MPVEMKLTVKKGGSAEFLAGIKELSKIGGKYNKEFMERCADATLTTKYGMKDRAFTGEQNPKTGEAWKELSQSWQNIRAKLGRSKDTEKLRFGFTRIPAEWGTRNNGKRYKVKAASWTSSGDVGLMRSIQRSEYINGSISVGTNDQKGVYHQTEGAGRGKVKRPFLGLGNKDYEIFNMLFSRMFKQIVAEAKAQAQ